MGKILIEQYIFCDTFESAKNISKAFDSFKFKFYALGNNSSVSAKRFIRKTHSNSRYQYKVLVVYTINYIGEFSSYGFIDNYTKLQHPELSEKLLTGDSLRKIDIIHEYRCLEENIYRDIFYYENFEKFFNYKLKPLMNKIHIACVIAFANNYRTEFFNVLYTENGMNYERGYIAQKSFNAIRPSEQFSNYRVDFLKVSLIWNWMSRHHKYKKDLLTSIARPITALTYALNRSSFEQNFYAVIGLESALTNGEKNVRMQLKRTISILFPYINDSDIDMFYNTRSDFAHGDIIFPDYYESNDNNPHWSDLTKSAEISTALLIITIRELVKNNAVKIIIDKNDNIIFKKHQLPF